jgi:hypothetical protein
LVLALATALAATFYRQQPKGDNAKTEPVKRRVTLEATTAKSESVVDEALASTRPK